MAESSPKFSTQEDTVKLLEEYHEFVKIHGENVRNRYVEFLKMSSDEVKEKYNSRQLSKKIGVLKRKYENQKMKMKMNNFQPPQDPNDARLFHLSESLWGKAAADSDLRPKAESETAWKDLQLKQLQLYAQQLDLQKQVCELRLQQFISDTDTDTDTITPGEKKKMKKMQSRCGETENGTKLFTDNSSASESDYDAELLNGKPQEHHHVAQYHEKHHHSHEQQRDISSFEGVEKDVVDDGYRVEFRQTVCQSNEKKSRKKKGKKRKAGKMESSTLEFCFGEGLKTLESDVFIGDTNKTSASKELKTLESGVLIEEVVAGNPNKKPASKGLQVKIRFTGKVKDSGHIIESTNNNSQIICLGGKDLIDGFSEGIEGMRVGGKRKLIIPPSMGFGDGGLGEKVPPNSWLEYEVELLGVRQASSRG